MERPAPASQLPDASPLQLTAARCLAYLVERHGGSVSRAELHEALAQRKATSLKAVVALARTLGLHLTASHIQPREIPQLACPALIELTDGRLAVVADICGDNAILYGLARYGDAVVAVSQLPDMCTGTVAQLSAAQTSLCGQVSIASVAP